jgi:zinc transport system substrate-binding protein
MHKKIIASSLLSFGLSMNAMANPPSVAVDIAPLHSLVSQVMDGVGQPDLIIPAEASPHSYSMRPSQAKALAKADLVFWIGEELTPWLNKALANVANSAEKVALLDNDITNTYQFRDGVTFEKHVHDEEHHGHAEHEHHDDHHEHKKHGHQDAHNENEEHGHHEAHDEHEHHDHGPGLIDRFLALFGSDEHDHEKSHHDKHDEHEHDHEGVDPHAWLDPVNAKAWITEIKNKLAKQDPSNAEKYEQNATKAIASLDQLIKTADTQVKALGDLKFVVFHDAYQYFEKRFDISAAGSISLGDAEDPSPLRVQEIKNTVAKLGVNCVFVEPQYDPGLVNSVFEGSNVIAIGVMDPLGSAIQPGNEHYEKLIQGMVNSLGQCKQ